MSEESILQAIRQRISDPEHVTDLGRGKAFPPTTMERVRAAESALGFSLPPLLTRLYTEVANGGFGPGYGMPGIRGCGTEVGRNDLFSLYRGDFSEYWRKKYPRWPDRMVRLAHLGCAMYACVDCAAADFPVFLFEPNWRENEIGFPNSLVPYGQTFDQWISAWASGADVQIPAALGWMFEDEG